jgi:hypothetical protein
MGEDLSYLEVLEQNPAIQEALIANETAKELKKRIIAEAKDNKDKILDSLDENYLTELAIKNSKDGQKIEAYGKMLEEGRTDYFMAETMKTASAYGKRVASHLNSDQILRLAQSEFQAMRGDFVKKNLYTEKVDKKGKPTGKYEFDKEKARAYVAGNLKDKDDVYMTLGRVYAMQQAQKK